MKKSIFGTVFFVVMFSCTGLSADGGKALVGGTLINGHSDYNYWDVAYADKLASEIMPASAVQLLLAGVTTARDLGAPLKDSLDVRDRINAGEIPGPRMFMSGPFIQHKAYPGTEAFRWGVEGERDARAKVRLLADAGVDIIKLIDQDEMTFEEAFAVVDEAHKQNLKVVAHSHRPDEIRRGLAIGVDNFEHTGLAAAPEYPPDIMQLIKERTATGRVRGGPLCFAGHPRLRVCGITRTPATCRNNSIQIAGIAVLKTAPLRISKAP